MSKLNLRPMTAEEIEFALNLRHIKLPPVSGDGYSLKPILKTLDMDPPMINESRAHQIYWLLFKYRRQIPPITTRNIKSFWHIVDKRMRLPNRKSKTKKPTANTITAPEVENL